MFTISYCIYNLMYDATIFLLILVILMFVRLFPCSFGGKRYCFFCFVLPKEISPAVKKHW